MKRRGIWKDQPEHILDIALDPVIKVKDVKGPDAYMSATDLIIRKRYNDAVGGDPQAIAAMLRLAIRSEKERFIVSRGIDWGMEIPQPRRKQHVADRALRLLDLAGGGHEYGRPLLKPWVVKLVGERFGKTVRPIAQNLVLGSDDDAPPFRAEHNPPPKKRSPEETRFKKGVSGNPRGRPYVYDKDYYPFNRFLSSKVPVSINGETHSLTRLQAVIHQANLRAIKGDQAIIKILENTYIQEYCKRWKGYRETMQYNVIPRYEPNKVQARPLSNLLRHLNLINPRTVSKDLLQPWVVEVALERLPYQLTLDEQTEVVRWTSTPWKVRWPSWWEASVPSWSRRGTH